MNTGQGILTVKDSIIHARAGIVIASRGMSDIILKAGYNRMPMHAQDQHLLQFEVPIRAGHQPEV